MGRENALEIVLNNWQFFEEELALETVLKGSEIFERYYRDRRPKLPKKINWVIDREIPIGINARSTIDSLGKVYIRLRTIPVPIDSAALVAHELEHRVMDLERFPVTAISSIGYETISSSLNSMVHDPLVDRRLNEFGFDVEAEHQNESNNQLKRIKGKSDPTHTVDQIIYSFNYAQNILWRQYVAGLNEPNELQTWLNQHFPITSKKGKILLKLIDRIGFDTPHKMKSLFLQIIDKNKLHRYGVKVSYPPTSSPHSDNY